MLRSILILCSVIYGISTVSSNVRRKRSIYRVGPASDTREGKDPPVVLQLSPGFFDYPGLKEIYAAIAKDRKPQEDLYLQVPPQKREAENPLRVNEAAFSLRINPVVPRNPLSVKKYNTSVCEEKKKEWCLEKPSLPPKVCQPIDTPTPIPTTCGPSKPVKTENIFGYCIQGRSKAPVHKDLCDECDPPVETTTQYVACFSVPPPTALQRLKDCNPTTGLCHVVPCTYRTADGALTIPPPTPPPCDAGLSHVEESEPNGKDLSRLKEPAKYYILVKRSPGGWRKKRSQMKRRFRIVPQLVEDY